MDPDVFPFMELHGMINSVQVDTEQSKFEELSKNRLAQEDVLIGTDICFWDDLVTPVFNLIRRAIYAGVGKVILADPDRSSFHKLSERCLETFEAEQWDRHISRPRKMTGSILVINNHLYR